MSDMTEIKLFPSYLEGPLSVPTSKSLTHRALICAALARGKSTISNVVFSEDVKATIAALQQIGAKFEIEDSTVYVKGVRSIRTPSKAIDCNESGSTLRFLIPILSLTNKPITFTGKPSLLKRPQSVYQTLFKEDGIPFIHTPDEIMVNGSVKARNYTIDGSISSQFFTGLMCSLPLLKKDSHITIKGVLESKGYIDLTINILEQFGIEIQELENGYYIPGNQAYKPFDYTVEGDFSQAAFFLVGGILNGSITIDNLSHESLQGDREIIDIIKRMKGRIIFTENGYSTTKSETNGATIDISNCPDLGPIVALLGTLSRGTTTIVNASRLRLKESDRIESTVHTLQTLGANIKTNDDDIIIYGKAQLAGGIVDSYNDHRIAMMSAIAALRCENPVILTQANAIHKSYPHFFEDYEKLGGKFTIKD
ncbi:3-phosphoshikimate 1-carboxyvinyltransferase [Candidatus Xianfuyuplasma coldseepsis]|uniref:3-phosphoshikimate 1-carboxyvinyltransferase n=1 Tax=Candidatus Xianfuyuplasma coldseepsis TaxID=2782163 RepID=A0A7L7KQ56_9MOLU|nr:3-phosphoshikimate 1-carboxyvinyltransferase [Xianfuyuplasma coldseepsis]QMS84931.1 3-phosphoshikimate 1-carboxyvinyltransferase [Xianfuyuplasma coldseepsis]